jgi:hypothetical protein
MDYWLSFEIKFELQFNVQESCRENDGSQDLIGPVRDKEPFRLLSRQTVFKRLITRWTKTIEQNRSFELSNTVLQPLMLK